MESLKEQGKIDKNYPTDHAAFRGTKRMNNIPKCTQPDKVTPHHYNRQGKKEIGREYTFGNIKIRNDVKGHTYLDDPSQNRGSHFNDNFGNHYNYPSKKK